jgi:hypothetical protein
VKAVGALIAVAVVVAAISFAVGSGFIDAGTVLLVICLSAVVVPLASRLRTNLDPWMWWVGPAGYLAKLLGSGARYGVLFTTYGGTGDAVRYHNNGLLLSADWRSFTVPPLGSGTGAGTQFVDSITGLIYALHRPTMLGGFFIFGTLAFIGQLLFYTAFRRGVPGGRLPVYAALVLFLPALIFWPSSIGKESLMIFVLGLGTYGLTRALDGYRTLWLLLAAAALGLAGLIRPHVAALLAASFALAATFGRARWTGSIAIRRAIVVLASIALLGVSLAFVGERFSLASPDDVDPFVSEIERRTQQGGSSVEGGAVASPVEFPAATMRVLFRPLPTEAHNIQSLASAVENVALLALIVARLPWMVRRLRMFRNPFVLMSASFTFGFVIVFSTIFNLGILTRQRAQVLPYLLAVIVALGWEERRLIRAEEPGLPVLTA